METAFTPNWLAILLAASSTFILGGLWYSPKIFGNEWMRLNGFNQEELAARKLGKIFGFSLLLSLISAVVLAYFLGPQTTLGFGTLAGFLVGVWVAASFGVTYLFESKPVRLFLINAGYHLVSFSMMGLILAVMKS